MKSKNILIIALLVILAGAIAYVAVQNRRKQQLIEQLQKQQQDNALNTGIGQVVTSGWKMIAGLF